MKELVNLFLEIRILFTFYFIWMQENIRDSNLPHFTFFKQRFWSSDINCLIKEVEEYNGDAYIYYDEYEGGEYYDG